ncbi:MAG: hypothetical protein C0524_10475 [Rhodobacter sp.]|nr:hypothetical protein [Rhodobacter sp.]
MSTTNRFALINRLTQAEPDDLDDLVSGFDRRSRTPGKDLAPCPGPGQLPPLKLAQTDAIAVGVSISGPIKDPADAAFRLCALAIEQDVEVIVLSSLDYSGMERFGFRTERIVGETAAMRDACRDQLVQFWGIELTLPV